MMKGFSDHGIKRNSSHSYWFSRKIWNSKAERSCKRSAWNYCFFPGIQKRRCDQRTKWLLTPLAHMGIFQSQKGTLVCHRQTAAARWKSTHGNFCNALSFPPESDWIVLCKIRISHDWWKAWSCHYGFRYWYVRRHSDLWYQTLSAAHRQSSRCCGRFCALGK